MRTKKNSNSRLSKDRLAKPGELDVIIIPARKALDAITSDHGFSPEDAVSLSLFASLAERVAQQKEKCAETLAAQRLNSSLRTILNEAAIDEEDLEKMKSDFFGLSMMIQTVPVRQLWRVIHAISLDEEG
jgi:hypothetical protein